MRKWLRNIALRIAEPFVMFACPQPTKEEIEGMKQWQTPLSVEIHETPAPPRPSRRSDETMTNDDIKQQIDHLRSLLTTPNLAQATIDEINTNLQELLRMQRTPRYEMQQVFQD